MFSLLHKMDRAAGQVGVLLQGSGVAIAEVEAVGNGKQRLRHCAYLEGDETDLLSKAVRGLTHRKLPAVTVLPPKDYQMLLVEAPTVPPDELRAAVRWRVKDLIDYHIDDAVIDVFQMPDQSRGGSPWMMYAIVARADAVKAQVAALDASGLRLEVIDILELSLRNVAETLEHDGKGVALLYLGDSKGVLLLVRQGVLYLTRHIETGTDALRSTDRAGSELIEDLALEVRRSLDYFESHYEQNPIPTLLTSGLDSTNRDLLATELGISVSNIEVGAFLETDADLGDETERRCLPAIGAALRKDRVAL